MSINSVCVVGRVEKDCVLGKDADGGARLRIPLLVVNRFGADSLIVGGLDEDTLLRITCVMRGRRAEKLSTRIKPGMKVSVDGYLEEEEYTLNGIRHRRIVISVTEFEFLTSRKDV